MNSYNKINYRIEGGIAIVVMNVGMNILGLRRFLSVVYLLICLWRSLRGTLRGSVE